MRFILLLSLLVMAPLFANPALDDLNHLLEKKKASTSIEKVQELDAYYLIFIFKASCPHCHQFAPILKDFAAHYHIEVKSYSTDGGDLESLQAEALTPELFQVLYASGGYKPAVPALFLVNRDTRDAYAVLFGEATPYELAERMQTLLTHLKEKFDG